MSAVPVGGMLILIVLVGAVVLGVAGVVVWLLVRRPHGGTDPSLMACGACGYSVRGVQTTACPECGADLREVGIVRPQTGGGGAAVWVVLVLSIVFLGAVMLFCVGGLLWGRLSVAPGPPVPPPPPTVTPQSPEQAPPPPPTVTPQSPEQAPSPPPAPSAAETDSPR